MVVRLVHGLESDRTDDGHDDAIYTEESETPTWTTVAPRVDALDEDGM
jgi:hypothetical protein